MSWITKFYISGKTNLGIIPIGCPNCHLPIELGKGIFSFGYYRHKVCHNLILEVRGKLRVDELLKEVTSGNQNCN